MPLASKDGKLIFKTVIEIVDGEEVEVQKLCSTCCDSGDGKGACCSFPYNNSGPQPANTAAEAIRLASQSASANSAAIEGSTWTVGYFKDGRWFEGGADFDPSRNQYNCTGYWTTSANADCEDVNSVDDCKGPFTYFEEGASCDSHNCPSPPSPPAISGICLYREDGKGVCKTFTVEQYDSGCVATEEEAQQLIDDGIEYLKQLPDNQIDCFEAIGGYVNTPVPNSGCPADKPFYYEIYSRKPNIGDDENPDGTCEPSYDINRTEESCVENDYTPLPGGISAEDWNSLLSPEWAVDYPEANLGGWGPTHCKSVSSESECEELNGIFCERAVDCPDDLSAGCPEDPGRSNPLP